MQALTTLFPVFFMIVLGLVSRIKGWITPEQKDGANAIVFNVLFPMMIFNVLLTSTIDSSAVFIVAYVLAAFLIAILVGKITSSFTGKDMSRISPFLMTTTEGGNVALPLYTSIVGMQYATNTIIYDLAGTLTAFVIVPVLVARLSSGTASTKELIRNIFSNSFVIAVIAALTLNLTGIYAWFSTTPFIAVYQSTISAATAPIVGMILFIIGYNLKINMKTLPSLMKLLVVKTAFYALVIAGFFIFFPELMADPVYRIAPIIYFMCPTGFAMPMLISPLITKEEESDFMSAFISVAMFITLIVYTAVVMFAS